MEMAWEEKGGNAVLEHIFEKSLLIKAFPVWQKKEIIHKSYVKVLIPFFPTFFYKIVPAINDFQECVWTRKG